MKKVLRGKVVSDKTDKTRIVTIDTHKKHPKYMKYLKKTTKCYVHDEKNTSREGDTVEIVECRPKSKLKRWDLLKVIK